MKTFRLHLCIFVCLLVFGIQTTTAQDGPVYTVTTWKIDIPENGSNAEFNTLFKEFKQKVTRPNSKIISERVMRHLSGSDSRDLVIITEYANWNDIDAAATEQGKLIEKAWPDENSRKQFFDKFGKYFTMHTDEIYSALPDMDKR